MRKLAVIGALSASMLGMAGGTAGAATVSTTVGGTMSNSGNACINIIALLSANDCSYGATRYPQLPWEGPIFATAFYTYDSIKDDPGDPGGVQPDGQDFKAEPGDGKLSVPLVGTFAVDDNGTPGDGSDDKISGTFSFGAADHWASTGNGDVALERWTAWDHQMEPTGVNFATAQPGGGFEYVIGARGKPIPLPLAEAADPTHAFGNEYAPTGLGDTTLTYWDRTGADLPVNQRVGIERSVGFGNTDDTGNTLLPNAGATTTGTFTNYECLDSDDDCLKSFILIGTSLVPGTSVALGPGFSNLVLIIKTGADGRVTAGEAYWTREYIIRNGPVIGNDPTNPGKWTTPNSWTGSRFTFKGCNPTGPIGEDDAFAVREGSSNNQLAVVSNDTLSCTDPNTVAIATQPTHGTAAVSGSIITYTPDVSGNDYYEGPDSLTYTITDGDGNVTAATTVAIDVQKVAPTASNCNGSSISGAPASCTVLTSSNAGNGSVAEHTIAATANVGNVGGTCSAANGVLTFAPTAGAGNGTGGCSFSITDVDGDTSNTAQFTVTVTKNGASGGGGSGLQLPSGGSSLDLLSLGALLAGLGLGKRRRRQ